ncbi:MAG: Holliday junction resolvase RecU [Clostridiales bacterium]|jgi:recombination protein U|nr:Holliday junction resolvase RecU [Clostridiales bacterium]
MSIYANKGKSFESLIQYANQRYRKDGKAIITKQHTLCTPLRNGTGAIVSAKYEEKATVDYIGRFGEIPIAFEAKHCSEDKIDLKRVEQHQSDFLHEWCYGGKGISFVLVSFKHEAFYVIPYYAWIHAVNGRKQKLRGGQASGTTDDGFVITGKASIRKDELPEAWSVKSGGTAALDYLQTVGKLWRLAEEETRGKCLECTYGIFKIGDTVGYCKNDKCKNISFGGHVPVEMSCTLFEKRERTGI